jgi:toxin secretion/phage lysis holin
MKVIDVYNGIVNQIEPIKFKAPLIAAVVFAPILELFGKYVFSDWEFLIFLTIVVILDTVTGVVKAWKNGNVSSEGFTGVILKVFVYSVFVILIHVMQSFSHKPLVIATFDWIGTFGYAAVIVREAISIIENLGAIQKGLIPEWILRRLKDFDDNGVVR